MLSRAAAILLALTLFACSATPDPVSESPDAAVVEDLVDLDMSTVDPTPDLAIAPDRGQVEEDVNVTADSGGIDMPTDADTTPECGPVPARFFLIGDSTVASGSGWGDGLASHLVDGMEIGNDAVSGSSSRSFYENGRFDDTRDALSMDDYLFIQFGHNDSKPDGDRLTDPGEAPDYVGSFRDYLERYITEARAADATPILVTSISRMTFGSDGTHRRTHGEYAPAVRKIAIDNDVVLLDLEEHSHEIFEALGEDETVSRYADDEDPSDRTHFPPDKAPLVAQMVADLMVEAPTLQCYVAP